MRLFAAQFVAYAIATIGTRYVAGGSTFGVAMMDAMLSVLGFYVIREVAEHRGTMLQYVAGSVAGGIAGMLV